MTFYVAKLPVSKRSFSCNICQPTERNMDYDGAFIELDAHLSRNSGQKYWLIWCLECTIFT